MFYLHLISLKISLKMTAIFFFAKKPKVNKLRSFLLYRCLWSNISLYRLKIWFIYKAKRKKTQLISWLFHQWKQVQGSKRYWALNHWWLGGDKMVVVELLFRGILYFTWSQARACLSACIFITALNVHICPMQNLSNCCIINICLRYCRYGVKHRSIDQSINQFSSCPKPRQWIKWHHK